MFKELLQENNKDVWLHISYDWLIPYEEINEDEDGYESLAIYKCLFILNSEIVDGYGETKEIALEQACLQYCIENGIKLEWLDETTREEYECNHSDVRKLLSIVTKENWLDEIQKLIAAIFAHDIKII